MSAPRVSVVIATFNRLPLLQQLLGQLAAQTVPPEEYEVVVVDDGSRVPVGPELAARTWPMRVVTLAQENAGAAAARHRGVVAARGELVVIVDDDMQVPPGFLAAHLAHHPAGTRRVALGRIRPPEAGELSLFERWHQENLDGVARRVLAGGRPLRGNSLYTGNVSFRREDYLAAGGFDPAFAQAEDAELGLRLEKLGCEFVLADAAYTVNGSDHVDLARWRLRARRYGHYDVRMARKHPEVRHASPWRFLTRCHPLTRPVLLLGAFAPAVSRAMAPATYAVAAALDRAGLQRVAHAALSTTFGLDYFRGVSEEGGEARALVADLVEFLARPDEVESAGRVAHLARFVSALRADHDTMQRYERKHLHHNLSRGRWARDAVQKIGLQILVAIRLMHLFRDAGLPLAAAGVSRTIRFLYGSDVHPDARIDPGIMIVHGMGLAISPASHVKTGCILFQNVTLGLGLDPDTKEAGAPTLEEDVQVMPGATLTGPLRVGARSKIGAGVALGRSVPPGSVVTLPAPEVRVRARGARTSDGEPVPAKEAEA